MYAITVTPVTQPTRCLPSSFSLVTFTGALRVRYGSRTSFPCDVRNVTMAQDRRTRSPVLGTPAMNVAIRPAHGSRPLVPDAAERRAANEAAVAVAAISRLEI
jgi:hypothetical protein